MITVWRCGREGTPAEATAHDGFPGLPALEISSRTPAAAPPAEDASSETPRGSPVDGGLHREREDDS